MKPSEATWALPADEGGTRAWCCCGCRAPGGSAHSASLGRSTGGVAPRDAEGSCEGWRWRKPCSMTATPDTSPAGGERAMASAPTSRKLAPSTGLPAACAEEEEEEGEEEEAGSARVGDARVAWPSGSG